MKPNNTLYLLAGLCLLLVASPASAQRDKAKDKQTDKRDGKSANKKNGIVEIRIQDGDTTVRRYDSEEDAPLVYRNPKSDGRGRAFIYVGPDYGSKDVDSILAQADRAMARLHDRWADFMPPIPPIPPMPPMVHFDVDVDDEDGSDGQDENGREDKVRYRLRRGPDVHIRVPRPPHGHTPGYYYYKREAPDGRWEDDGVVRSRSKQPANTLEPQEFALYPDAKDGNYVLKILLPSDAPFKINVWRGDSVVFVDNAKGPRYEKVIPLGAFGRGRFLLEVVQGDKHLRQYITMP